MESSKLVSPTTIKFSTPAREAVLIHRTNHGSPAKTRLGEPRPGDFSGLARASPGPAIPTTESWGTLEATATARRIMQLREEHRELIVANLGKRTDRGLKLLENLYNVPVVTGTSVEKLTGLSTPNANALIQSLVTLGLLKEVTGQKRNRRYIYAPYWVLFSEDENGPQSPAEK